MSGKRAREQRRAEQERAAADRREREAAETRRRAFFASFDAEDSAEGPALPCPECDAFGRRWATPEEARPALREHDARWGLTPPEGPDPRRVAVCPACGGRAVMPDFPG